MPKDNAITVILAPELKRAARADAALKERTMNGHIRHLLRESAEQAGVLGTASREDAE